MKNASEALPVRGGPLDGSERSPQSRDFHGLPMVLQGFIVGRGCYVLDEDGKCWRWEQHAARVIGAMMGATGRSA